MSQIYEAKVEFENGQPKVETWKRTGCETIEEWLIPGTVEPSETRLDGAQIWQWEENGKPHFVATMAR